MEHLFIVNTWFAQALIGILVDFYFVKKPPSPFLHFFKMHLGIHLPVQMEPCPTAQRPSRDCKDRAGWPFLHTDPCLEGSLVCQVPHSHGIRGDFRLA